MRYRTSRLVLVHNQLRWIVAEFVHPYSHDRRHRRLSLQAPAPKPQASHCRTAIDPY